MARPWATLLCVGAALAAPVVEAAALGGANVTDAIAQLAADNVALSAQVAALSDQVAWLARQFSQPQGKRPLLAAQRDWQLEQASRRLSSAPRRLGSVSCLEGVQHVARVMIGKNHTPLDREVSEEESLPYLAALGQLDRVQEILLQAKEATGLDRPPADLGTKALFGAVFGLDYFKATCGYSAEVNVDRLQLEHSSLDELTWSERWAEVGQRMEAAEAGREEIAQWVFGADVRASFANYTLLVDDLAAGTDAVPAGILKVVAWGLFRQLKGLDSTGCHPGRWVDDQGLRVLVALHRRFGPAALVEKDSHQRTLLMETYMHPSCQHAFGKLLDKYMRAGLSLSGTDDRGINIIMMAAIKGDTEYHPVLKTYQINYDLEHGSSVIGLSGISHHATFMVAAVYAGLLCVALALSWWRAHSRKPGSAGFKDNIACLDLGIKFAVLVSTNYLIVYRLALWEAISSGQNVLVKVWLILGTSWCVEPDVVYPFIFCMISVGSAYFAGADLHAAALGKRPAAGVAVQPHSIFQDPGTSFAKCCQTFILMMTFAWLYVANIWQTIEMTLFARMMWALALFVQVHVTTSQGEERVESGETLREFLGGLPRWFMRFSDQKMDALWGAMFARGQFTLEVQADDGSSAVSKLPVPSKFETLARFVMCYFANGVLQSLIVATLPLYLASSETAMDFVLNAFAITFIIDLDNTEGDLKFTVESYLEAEQAYKPLISTTS